jgi:hypothetical protein
MKALTLMIKPIRFGWVVRLSDGRDLARFYGPGARWRASRYLARTLGIAT